MLPLVVCLMGPTAAGKTAVASSLCKRFPFDVVSVDSALVYRGMDIGTAKPDADTLARVPHRLIDIREPVETYSAGEFVRDAGAEIRDILEAGRLPLLVGGTMLYFRALIEGIAELPKAAPKLRAKLDAEAAALGWPGMHARLAGVDPEAAERIEPKDSQRIQRALEVYLLTGRPLSDWQQATAEPGMSGVSFLKIALSPSSRSLLHERIERRLDRMLEAGFIGEIDRLMRYPGLTAAHPSMRAVGYRQFWSYRSGEMPFDEARAKALAATRQLAKRQYTWLRGDTGIMDYDPLEAGSIDAISREVASRLVPKARSGRGRL